ncbi:MAG: S46 family peptidase, partial [Calditrichia bacterium]
MNRAIRVLMAVLLLLFLASSLFADEGMWMLNQLDELNWKSLQERGMEISPKDILKLKEAVVIIDGGTGSFVSSQGLVFTNHHVAYRAIQRASSKENNYFKDGFLAANQSDEIPIPGYEVMVPKEFKEVTKKILSVVKEGMSPLERFEAIEKRKNELVEKAEKKQGIEAKVAEMYNGIQYYLVTYQAFKDVRLVYAPPSSIGKYGGDIDNWMWPRHTGDFAFFRVYASKDGKPADYAENNVAYHPDKYLNFSAEGVDDGDMTFVLGYPGRTYRYRTSYSISYHQQIYYPFVIELCETILNVLDRESKKDEEVAIKTAGLNAGLNNSLKNRQGMLYGFKKLHLLEKKRETEEAFRAFVNSDAGMSEKYGSVLEEISSQYDNLEKYARKRNWLGTIRFSSLPYTVYRAYRFALEVEKPEAERDPEYSDKNREKLLKRLKIQNEQYVRAVDKEILKALLEKMAALPGEQKINLLDEIVSGAQGEKAAEEIEAYVEKMYAKSQLQNLNDALTLFEKTAGEIRKMDDPLIKFAVDFAGEFIPFETKDKEFDGAIQKLRADYIRALFAWKGNNLYPDANRTLRFTYGAVQGYAPADAIKYLPHTYLKGVIEKETGKDPFIVPEKLKELYYSKNFGKYADPEKGDVPVDFLHTVDTTGGNSGSPVLNGRGQLVGILFDGNYEAMTADYQYDPAITRSISVDSRYILFIMDKFSGAKNLLDEMK